MKINSIEFQIHLKEIGFKKGNDLRRSKGKPFSKGHKVNKGRKLIFSDEHRKNISKSKQGKASWNKGLTKIDERVEKYSSKLRGKKFSEIHRLNLSKSLKGKPKAKWSLEHRLLFSTLKKGEKNNFWKGGITPLNRQIRESLKYKLWRESVFQRDEFTCKICKQKGRKLTAHHIKLFSKFPELRFDINNGLTLCWECHKKIHKSSKYHRSTAELEKIEREE